MEILPFNYTVNRTLEEEQLTNLTGDILITNSTVEEVLATSDMFENYWFWTIVDGFLLFIILGGNTLTILAVTLSRRLSSLISNQFVLNLAVSDFLVGLTLPYHLTFYISEDLGTVKATCILRFILITLACCASIYNLIAIAVDRYIAIVHPLHYGRYMTKTVTRFMLGLGWTLAVGVSIIPIFWNNWDEALQCEMSKVLQIIPSDYTTCILAPMFSLIWVVMLILYWRIWREAACHAKRMRSTSCHPSGPNDWKSIQVVLLVLGSFSICWMPFIIVVCARSVPMLYLHNPTVYKAAFSLAMANSGINPIIYAWKNAGFRKAFINLLRCRNPDYIDFNQSFRATSPAQSDRKVPLESVSRGTQSQRGSVIAGATMDSPLPNEVKSREKNVFTSPTPQELINNNRQMDSVNSECHIIENMMFNEDVAIEMSNCHVIENLAFDDSLELSSSCHNAHNLPKSNLNYHSSATLPLEFRERNVCDSSVNSI